MLLEHIILKSRYLAEECSDFNSVGTRGKLTPWRIHGTAERRCRPASAGGMRPAAKCPFSLILSLKHRLRPCKHQESLVYAEKTCASGCKTFFGALISVSMQLGAQKSDFHEKTRVLHEAAYRRLRPACSAARPCYECARARAFHWYQQN